MLNYHFLGVYHACIYFTLSVLTNGCHLTNDVLYVVLTSRPKKLKMPLLVHLCRLKLHSLFQHDTKNWWFYRQLTCVQPPVELCVRGEEGECIIVLL